MVCVCVRVRVRVRVAQGPEEAAPCAGITLAGLVLKCQS